MARLLIARGEYLHIPYQCLLLISYCTSNHTLINEAVLSCGRYSKTIPHAITGPDVNTVLIAVPVNKDIMRLELLSISLSYSGTHGYMAPEVIRKGVQYTSSADWFSLGCVLYKLLKG